jgi:hypothetical protein
MKNNLKYIIPSIAAIICVFIYVYFSPYHSCIRNLKSMDIDERIIVVRCVQSKY